MQAAKCTNCTAIVFYTLKAAVFVIPTEHDLKCNDLIIASKHWNKRSPSDQVFHLLCCLCACLWAVVQTWWGGCLSMVFAQSGALNRSCWAPGGRLHCAMCVFVCVDLRTESWLKPLSWWRWLMCSVRLQPVLASANWQLEFDFAHWPLLHPWKCVCVCVFQIRFTECARHPGVEDSGL